MATIKNVVFDFGGVIALMDFNRARSRFLELGVKNIDDYLDVATQKDFFGQLEDGTITAEQFREKLSKVVGREFTLEQCEYAWKGFIVDVPERNLQGLRDLRAQGYSLALLSNTNPFIGGMMMRDPNFDGKGHSLISYFDGAFLSFERRLMKPDARIFQLMLDEMHYNPQETLFVDDSQGNCTAAQALGIHTFCPLNGENWPETIKKYL